VKRNIRQQWWIFSLADTLREGRYEAKNSGSAVEIRQFAAEDNLKKAEQFIKEAAPEAQIIVFPEDFITGPLSEEVDTAILNDAEAAYQLRRA
jgi:hypothetical protein